MRIKCGTTFKQLCLCYVVWFVIGNKWMDFSRREVGLGEVRPRVRGGKGEGVARQSGATAGWHTEGQAGTALHTLPGHMPWSLVRKADLHGAAAISTSPGLLRARTTTLAQGSTPYSSPC